MNHGILGMRSTKQGKLLITMEKNEEVRRNVQELLRNDKVMDKKITSLEDRDMETIFIRGLDAVADKDDVTKAIEYYIKDIRHKYFKMSELRPMSNNRQTDTVTLTKKDAALLLENRYLTVGFVRCYMEPRVVVRRCRRCWGYGHNDGNCQETDRSKQCFKCGETGHNRKECQNNDKCPLCNTEGHAAGSGSCPIFRSNLARIRREIRTQPRAVLTNEPKSYNAQQH